MMQYRDDLFANSRAAWESGDRALAKELSEQARKHLYPQHDPADLYIASLCVHDTSRMKKPLACPQAHALTPRIKHEHHTARNKIFAAHNPHTSDLKVS